MLNFVNRHVRVLIDAWRIESVAKRSRVVREHTEFLPAVLEVTESPASPLAVFGLWFLIIGVCAALAWSFFGRLDVVVSAPGRIVPADQVKVVQPTELGTVRAVHVVEGERVKAGQLLVELDPTTASAEDSQARTGLVAAEIDRARSAAILNYLEGGSRGFTAPSGVSKEAASVQRSLIGSQVGEYEARRNTLVQQREEHRAELTAAVAERRKLQETLPLLDSQIKAREQLVEKGHFPRLRLFELQEQRIERVRNIDVQGAAASKARAGMAAIDAQLAQLKADLTRSTVKDLAEAQDNRALRTNEISKTARRSDLMRLRSPVDGFVQQLSVHTLGGVVQPAQSLMVIVPEASRLVVEAKIPNQKAGFVRVGQEVRVKVDAFPFTDYGVVMGKLEGVSSDSIEDEKLGLVYNARISLRRDKLQKLAVGPGMGVVAEILTARRRIIQYLLSPISSRLDEAGRER